jgi:tRNA nucleotidyltransferase (CCA-adding enzyme)
MRFSRFFKESTAQEFLDHALPMSVRNAIKKSGGKIYQIGGAVRDSLIDKVSKDLDVIVVGVDLKELNRILTGFGKVDSVGKSFGVLKFTPRHFKKGDEPIDVSVPRVDSKSTGDGHKDFEIELGKHITLQQDQMRRDFWMNAIAKDVETGEVIDVDGKGMVDIDSKQVRMVSPEAFVEDPLRMLRAFQFASRFDFKIEEETLQAIKDNAEKVTTVSPDRFKEEFHKLFMKSKSPSVGINYMIETGVMGHLFPDMEVDEDSIKKMDTLNKDQYNTFLTLLFRNVSSEAATKFIKEGIRETNDVVKVVAKAIDFLNDHDISISDEDLVLFSLRDNNFSSLSVVDIIKKSNLVGRLTSLQKNGTPINFKELSVKGDELSVPKHERGRKLQELLRFAVMNKTNDREKLLSI